MPVMAGGNGSAPTEEQSDVHAQIESPRSVQHGCMTPTWSGEWEFLHHSHTPSPSPSPSPGPSRVQSVTSAEDSSRAQAVQIELTPDDGSVTLRITPVTSPQITPPESPREPSMGPADAAYQHSGEGIVVAQEEASAGHQDIDEAVAPPSLAAAEAASARSSDESPLSGSMQSLQHLSDHIAPPFGTEGEHVPAPPSLPELSSPASLSAASSAALDLSFAEQLQAAAAASLQQPSLAAFGGGPSSPGSGVGGDVSAAQSPSTLGSSYSDLAASQPGLDGAPMGWGMHPVLQQAIAQLESHAMVPDVDLISDDEELADAEAASDGDVEGHTPAADAAAAGNELSYYMSLKQLLGTGMPAAAAARLWNLLKDCGAAIQAQLPALPPHMAQPVACMYKRLQRVDWTKAALGVSLGGIAVLSWFLYRSQSSNRRLKAALGRKEADLLDLVSRVVRMQHERLRPRNVPIIRHTSSMCSFPSMDII